MDGGGRQNQKRRTRKDLLQAAARLMKRGHKPSLEEVAEAAMVSRATAYRFFPSVDALLAEAAVDIAMPEPALLFDGMAEADPVARVQHVDDVVHRAVLENEAALRLMLAHTVQRGLANLAGDAEAPARQNRRSPLLDAALDPARAQFAPKDLARLKQALALVVGTEAMVVLKDVLQLDEEEGQAVRRWAIRALVEAARG